jgi:glycosyltransferase involved in cell wall biosynthesis
MPKSGSKLQNLSVIVTSYNKITFLPRFFERAEILMKDGAEIVLIDDCSTDGSSILLERFAKDKRNLKYIALSTNMGSATARNTGLQNSSRHFIFFLDIDDDCDSNNIANVLDACIILDCDLAVGNFIVPPDMTPTSMPLDTDENLITQIEAVSSNISKSMGYWSYIYRQSFVKAFSIRFFPTRSESHNAKFILDDVFWLLLLSATKGKLLVTPTNTILYLYNRPEQTKSSWSFYLFQIKQTPKLCLTFLKELKDDSRLRHCDLQKNTFNWLCRSLRILSVKEVFSSGFFSVKYLLSLRKETSQGLNLFEYCRGVFQVVLFSVKNSIGIRKRVRALLGTDE